MEDLDLGGGGADACGWTETHSYYQIAIGPTGAMVDIDRAMGLNTLWSSQGQVAAHRGDRAWTLEIRLPVTHR